MRSVLILGLIGFLASAGYGIHRNPLACEKLGLDLMSDMLAIYISPPPPESKTPGPDAAPVTADAATAQPLSPQANPVVPPQLPVVTPVTPSPAVAASPAPLPSPAPAPAAPKPQYSVGFVAALPSASPPTPIPQPAPLPPAAPRAATYPTFTDYSSGLEAARKNHVPLLVLFTGSDWCQYCQMLEREVLSTSNFTKFSSTHFVFVTIDDLRNSPVADSDKAQIHQLEQKFNITGFPSLVVLDENEQEKGRVEGYDPGSGPAAVIQQLDPLAKR